MDTIIIKIKQVYGRNMIYPVSPAAQIFADIAGTKTLSKSNIQNIEALGYVIQIETASLTKD